MCLFAPSYVQKLTREMEVSGLFADAFINCDKIYVTEIIFL